MHDSPTRVCNLHNILLIGLILAHCQGLVTIEVRCIIYNKCMCHTLVTSVVQGLAKAQAILYSAY